VRRRRSGPDPQLVAASLILIVFGLAMVYSASAFQAGRTMGDSWYYAKRQAAFSAVGLALMAAFARAPYARLRGWIWPALGATALALVAVLFTARVAGARRWFRLGGFGLQPAEFAKLGVILYLADYLDRKRSRLERVVPGLLVPVAVVGTILLLISLEPDLGTPTLLFVVTLLMLFTGGTRPGHIAGSLACALPILAYELIRYPYRRRRLMNFLDPFADAQGAGYQLVQSISAAGTGGLFGVGLGRSTLKLGYLPAAHTDFIFPVLCEELGLAGSLGLLALFIWFFLRGMRAARAAPDMFGSLVAAGISFLVLLQALFNMAMSVGLIPTKGLPLPFFSYGGSSTLALLSGVGMLLSVSKQAREVPARSS